MSNDHKIKRVDRIKFASETKSIAKKKKWILKNNEQDIKNQKRKNLHKRKNNPDDSGYYTYWH